MMTLIVRTTNKASGQSTLDVYTYDTDSMVKQFTHAERGNLLAGKRVTHDSKDKTVRYVDFNCAHWLFDEKCKPATDIHGNFCSPLDKLLAE